MSDNPNDDRDDWNGYRAAYCEGCGKVTDTSNGLGDWIREPTSRVEVLNALKANDMNRPVVDTVAEEIDECECGGTIVKRYYVTGEPPEPDIEPPDDYELPENVRGPKEDALIGIERDLGTDWVEAQAVPGLDPNDLPGPSDEEDSDEL